VSSFVDVAIVGAGPYGLSVAAHLGALGVDYRIFGKPMQLWREHMPPGMRLKSDGASSDLVDVDDATGRTRAVLRIREEVELQEEAP
jgi:cation diffusion facilitator CzcD-associated flavoprotein CzcO